jgi:hypothetical protein
VLLGATCSMSWEHLLPAESEACSLPGSSNQPAPLAPSTEQLYLAWPFSRRACCQTSEITDLKRSRISSALERVGHCYTLSLSARQVAGTGGAWYRVRRLLAREAELFP